MVGIINSLKEYDHHVIILRGPETLRGELPGNCKVVNLHMKRWRYFFFKIFPLWKYIRRNKIDIVHSHLYQPNILARLVTPSSVPVFNNIHSISSMGCYTVNSGTLYLEKFTYRKQHHIIAVSNAVMNDFNTWIGLRGPHTVLNNFIEDRFAGTTSPKATYKPGDHLKMVAVGNLRYEKNYPYLIEVFKKLPANVSLDIYGDGVLRSQFEKEIKKYNLNIRLCGIRNDLEKVLPAYDVFVMSSHFEGQPVALLEAMACGLPAIVPDIPVLQEVCEEDAIYINTMDVSSLTEVIDDIQRGFTDLRLFATKGLTRAKHFSRKEYMRKLKKLYAEVAPG